LNAFSKFELDLPEKGFIFCCFNNSWKITPETFDSWARIINQVEGSVLWLLESTPQIKGRLIKEAELRGISKDRLIFAKKMPLGKHLSRHHLADLFLDTLPVNAHTTASDALLTGLPVLTLRGESFAGRVSASLLNAIGLSELITITQVEYENLAIKLATSPNDLQSIKEKLSTNKSTKPLFDSSLFVKHIEQAYIEMHDRYQSSLPPEHIYIL
jgi:predicted O-linked N-acetylglucosamine transferase (SPINDLY family)